MTFEHWDIDEEIQLQRFFAQFDRQPPVGFYHAGFALGVQQRHPRFLGNFLIAAGAERSFRTIPYPGTF